MSHGPWAQNISWGKWRLWGIRALREALPKSVLTQQKHPRKGPVGDAWVNHTGSQGNLTWWPGLKELWAGRKLGDNLGTSILITVFRKLGLTGFWGNCMKKCRRTCLTSCKVLLLLVAMVKQKLDIKPSRHNVPCLSFVFPSSSIFQEELITREHSECLYCGIELKYWQLKDTSLLRISVSSPEKWGCWRR